MVTPWAYAEERPAAVIAAARMSAFMGEISAGSGEGVLTNPARSLTFPQRSSPLSASAHDDVEPSQRRTLTARHGHDQCRVEQAIAGIPRLVWKVKLCRQHAFPGRLNLEVKMPG